MATALLLFSPLPSTSFIHRNPNPIPVSPLRGFPPFSISVRRVTRRSAVTSVCAVASTASPVDHLDISKLGISEQIVSALSRRGITELFPIQRAVLEPAMEGRDMIGRAITGSGKTLAFGIPILDKIIRHQSQSRKKKIPSALVLAPTRELARQVQREFKESAPNLSSTCLYGGIPITDQVRALKFGIDIAVGTPGRIIDLVERGALNLSEVRFVVLDEADQMLAIGFQEDVECILSYLPVKKQSMLFSATMPSWVNELSRKFLKDPLVIDLVCKSEKKLAEGISLYSIPSAASGKQTLLPILISQYAHGGKTIIFTKTRNDAEELSRSMGSIIGSKALHGNMQQSSRDRTIAAFRSGRFDVLVATDVAARGLDIPDVDLVIHFEMPNTSEIFIHRSGRTGRAGKKGTTVLMFTENQRRDVRTIERDLRCKFEELPRNENGGGNRTGLTHGRGSSSEGYNLQQRRQDHSSSMRFGSEGRYQGSYANSNSKKSHSNTSKFSEGNSGYQRFRKSGFSSVPGTGQSKYVHSDRSQRVQYDSFMDFDDNYLSENGAGTSGSRFAKSPSRSRSAKNQPRIRRNSSDSIFNDDFDFPEDKRRQSKSKHESFEQILDLFKDNY